MADGFMRLCEGGVFRTRTCRKRLKEWFGMRPQVTDKTRLVRPILIRQSDPFQQFIFLKIRSKDFRSFLGQITSVEGVINLALLETFTREAHNAEVPHVPISK